MHNELAVLAVVRRCIRLLQAYEWFLCGKKIANCASKHGQTVLQYENSNWVCCNSQSQSRGQRLSACPDGFLSMQPTSIWQIIGQKIFMFISQCEDFHPRVLMQMIIIFCLSLTSADNLSDLGKNTRYKGVIMCKQRSERWQTIEKWTGWKEYPDNSSSWTILLLDYSKQFICY